MKQRQHLSIRNFLLFPLFGVILSLCTSDGYALSSPSPGSPAPSFSLTGLDGKKYSPQQFKGKIVVLEWYNSQCPFVLRHYNSQNMQTLQKELAEKGVIWLSIASSAPGKQGHLSADEHQEKIREWGSKVTTLLIDENGEVGRAYGAKTTPHMFVIDQEGNIAYEGAIDDMPFANRDEMANAQNYIRQAVGELLAGKKVSVSSTKSYGCSVKY